MRHHATQSSQHKTIQPAMVDVVPNEGLRLFGCCCCWWWWFPHQDEISRPPFATTTDPAARKELVQKLHLLKTDIFMEMVESGAMPLRPGVARLVQEAIAAGEQPTRQALSSDAAVNGGCRRMQTPLGLQHTFVNHLPSRVHQGGLYSWDLFWC
jgi:hypothetical protein